MCILLRLRKLEMGVQLRLAKHTPEGQMVQLKGKRQSQHKRPISTEHTHSMKYMTC